MFLNSKFHTDKSINPNTSNIILNKGKTNISIYFSPQSKPITNHVMPLIQTAEKSIHINMFFLTHKKIVEELINAHNRGVDVKIILDGSFVNIAITHTFLAVIDVGVVAMDTLIKLLMFIDMLFISY